MYAQIRGVRVVIEIDSPGHAGNGWQWGKVRFILFATFKDKSSRNGRALASYVGSSGFHSMQL